MRYGWILWLLGYPDQARRTIEANLDDLWSIEHGISVCIALGQGPCQVALASGDLADAERYIDAMAEQAARYSLSLWQSWAHCLRGVLLIQQDKAEEGLRLLRGKYLWPEYAVFLASYARAMGASGDIAGGLATISDAIAQAERRGEGWHIAELLRIKGELLLLQVPNDPAAEEHFHLSLAWARRQQALSWELRTAMSLANLRRSQGRRAEARSGLAAVFGRFSEGADTTDVQSARKLLGELN
jgi:predicted ATPase